MEAAFRLRSSHSPTTILDDEVAIELLEWPVKQLVDFRRENDESSYLVEWEPSSLSIQQLCKNILGQPLLGMALELIPEESPHHAPPGSRRYTVTWNTTWVPYSDLEDSAWLIHEYWTRRFEREMLVPVAPPCAYTNLFQGHTRRS